MQSDQHTSTSKQFKSPSSTFRTGHRVHYLLSEVAHTKSCLPILHPLFHRILGQTTTTVVVLRGSISKWFLATRTPHYLLLSTYFLVWGWSGVGTQFRRQRQSSKQRCRLTVVRPLDRRQSSNCVDSQP